MHPSEAAQLERERLKNANALAVDSMAEAEALAAIDQARAQELADVIRRGHAPRGYAGR